MALKHAFGNNFERPPCPKNWNAEERQFYNALMDLLDQLFQKTGKTRMQQMITELTREAEESNG